MSEVSRISAWGGTKTWRDFYFRNLDFFHLCILYHLIAVSVLLELGLEGTVVEETVGSLFGQDR